MARLLEDSHCRDGRSFSDRGSLQHGVERTARCSQQLTPLTPSSVSPATRALTPHSGPQTACGSLPVSVGHTSECSVRCETAQQQQQPRWLASNCEKCSYGYSSTGRCEVVTSVPCPHVAPRWPEDEPGTCRCPRGGKTNLKNKLWAASGSVGEGWHRLSASTWR